MWVFVKMSSSTPSTPQWCLSSLGSGPVSVGGGGTSPSISSTPVDPLTFAVQQIADATEIIRRLHRRFCEYGENYFHEQEPIQLVVKRVDEAVEKLEDAMHTLQIYNPGTRWCMCIVT